MRREVPVTEARAQFSDLINRVGYGKESIVLTRHGRPLVVLVPAEESLEAESEQPAETTMLDLTAQPSIQRHDFTIAAQHRTPPTR